MNDISTLTISPFPMATAAILTSEVATPADRPAATTAIETETGSPEWFAGLRAMLAACLGSNKNDMVDPLLAACISDGVDTGTRLISIAKHMRFDSRHAGARLKHGIGHQWRRSAEGRYTLLD